MSGLHLEVNDSVLKISQVMAVCGKSRSAIYKEIKKGLFPKQLKLTPRSSGWSRKEIERWLEDRKSERDRLVPSAR